VLSGEIKTHFVGSNDQLANIYTKSLRGPRVETICEKLGAYDIYIYSNLRGSDRISDRISN